MDPAKTESTVIEEEEKINKIVVLGDNPTTIGFRLAGVKRVFEEDDKLKETFEEQINDKTNSIIVINEYLLDQLPPRLRKRAEDSINPIIVPIPDKDMRESQSESLKALIRRAIGFDLMGE